MRRDFPGASQRRPHALATAWQWLSIHNGGAVRFTNPKDPHRRRNRGAGAKHKPRPVERSEGRF